MRLLINNKYEEIGFWSLMKCQIIISLSITGLIIVGMIILGILGVLVNP